MGRKREGRVMGCSSLIPEVCFGMIFEFRVTEKIRYSMRRGAPILV
jgi:hypothetical protein